MANSHSFEIVGRRVWMTLPYGSPFKGRIKSAGAHWDAASQRWWIGTVGKDIVLPIMQEAMAADSAALVTVEVDLDAAHQTEYAGRQTISLAGVPLVTRYGRDGTPKLAENVLIARGRIHERGGSIKYPWTGWDSGTAVLVEVVEPVAKAWLADGIAKLPGEAEAEATADA